MTTLKEIVACIESQTGHPLNNDEGITAGCPNTELTGVIVTWMVTPKTINAAKQAGYNCIVHHEALYYPYPGLSDIPKTEWEKWTINANRAKMLHDNNINAIRIHGSADEISIFDTFALQLGLKNPLKSEPQKSPYYKIFTSPVATLGELINHVKEKTNTSHLRVTTNPLDTKISKIGLGWGGMGLFVNVQYLQELVQMGIDVLIAGESDSYGMRFLEEIEIPVIETSHELSENEGLKVFADKLKRYLKIDVRFADCPCVWKII